MNARVLEEVAARQTMTRLVADLGVRSVLKIVAEIVEAESDQLLMAGDRQKAARYLHDFRVVQRALETLRNSAAGRRSVASDSDSRLRPSLMS